MALTRILGSFKDAILTNVVSSSAQIASDISGSFVAKADKSAISGSIVGGVSGSATSTGSFGMVGIGTASPATPFHVSSAEDVVATFESTDDVCKIHLKDDGGTGVLLFADDDVFGFSQGATITAYWLSNGAFQLGSGGRQFQEVATGTKTTANATNTTSFGTMGNGQTFLLFANAQDDSGVHNMFYYSYSNDAPQCAAVSGSPHITAATSGTSIIFYNGSGAERTFNYSVYRLS